MEKPSFAVIGCGKLGTSLAWRLFGAGYPVAGLSSRSLASAKSAADHIGTPRYFENNWEAVAGARLVFITTPDDRIAQACAGIVEHGALQQGTVVLHCSGSLASDILAPARSTGAHVGSMHPLQSFPDPRQGVNLFEGILISVEGDAPATDVARRVASDLGAFCADVRADSKTLYHAAAVVASNYLVSLLDVAFALNAAAGLQPKESAMGLMPLIKGTLGNVQSKGVCHALTGPIARGDVQTVSHHLREMREKVPGLVSLYKSLGRHTIGIALAKGTLQEDAAAALREILKD